MVSSNKVLFVGQDYTQVSEGLSVVTKRNLRLLQQCGYEVNQILIKNPGKFTKLKNLLLGESYGYTHEISIKIEEALHKDYYFVFFDRSLFGPLVKAFAKKGNRTICFFHNVEAHLSKSRLKVTRNPFYWIFYHNICRNESVTIKYADTIISISERDQQELRTTYGLKNVYLMPTSFTPAPADCLQNRKADNESYCLFVGSDFFANQEGIKWFISEVVPNISCKLVVVGSICNSLMKLQLPPNVQLKGYVDNLNEYYINAMCVISPIFSGSGLKTKTIEALRYGKMVFGTDEAFVGINSELFDKIGKLCNTKEEFIQSINTYSKNPVLLNEGSLEVFNDYFSDEVAFKTLNSIINSSTV